MRFIYIDSHGKEVSIPTVDALALRIELGAITESTRLYDEAANRWAPASEHEIYRTLQRERDEKIGGFVAPPPPMAPPPTPVPPPVAKKAPPAPKNPFDVLEGAPSPEVVVAPPAAPPKPADPFGGLDFGLTLDAPPPEPPPSESASAAFDRTDTDSFAMGNAELSPGPDAPGSAPAAAPASKPAKKEDGASFDFQGFGGLLADDEDEDDEATPAAPPTGGGMVLEGVLAGSGYDAPIGQGSAVVGAPMDLEQPLSELPIDQAGWTPRERMGTETHEDGSTASGGDDPTDDARPERLQRRRPTRAPSPPERKASPVPALIGALVLLAVVGGGVFGWTRIKERRAAAAAAAAAADPPVAIPAISAELEPRMRELADSAQADWLTALRTTLPAEKGIPMEPDGDWLAGSYLADATRYASIEQYWKALDAYLTDVEATDAESFAALYQARLAAAGITGGDATAMLERARAGFLAGRTERRPVYQQLRDIVQSALGLHEFLLANEAQIDYDPAAGGASRDPVLEAVPATPELGKEMWSQVDKITESLDALGALDRVTTDRLLDLFTAKLGQIPIR